MPYINNSGIKIYYEVVGQGHPIIFHHGNGSCAQDWYDMGYVDLMKDHYQLILFDMRGYGKSSKPHDKKYYTAEQITSDSIALMNHLQITKATCFGYSMGGRCAYWLMNSYPDYFDSFIVGGMHPYSATDLGTKFFEWLSIGIPYLTENIEAFFGTFPKEMKTRYLKNDHKAILAACSLHYPDVSTCFSKIDVPCLIYAGDEDFDFDKIKNTIKQFNNCKYHFFAGLNHLEAYWRGDLIAPIIIDFLKR